MGKMSVTLNKSTCVEEISIESLAKIIMSQKCAEGLKAQTSLDILYTKAGLREAIESGDKSRYKTLKSGMPAVLISLNCDTIAKPKRFEVLHQVQLDVDNLSKDDVTRLAEQLAAIPAVSLVFVSPSLCGVKAIIHYEPTNLGSHYDTFESAKSAHKYAYNVCLSAAKNAMQGVQFDESCSNLNRLCYIPLSGFATYKTPSPVSIDFSQISHTQKHKAEKGPALTQYETTKDEFVSTLRASVPTAISTHTNINASTHAQAQSIFQKECDKIKKAVFGTIHVTVRNSCCRLGYFAHYFQDMNAVRAGVYAAFCSNREAGGGGAYWLRKINDFIDFGMQTPKTIETHKDEPTRRFIEPTSCEGLLVSSAQTPGDINAQVCPGSTHIVRGGHGVGKTSIIGKHVIEMSKAANFNNAAERFITTFITPRVSLSESISDKFMIDSYIHERNTKIGSRRSMVITTNSIVNDLFRQCFTGNYNLYIDEFSTIRKDIFSRSGTMKKKAGKVYAKLLEVMREASCLVCSDADITDIDIEIIKSCRSHTPIYYHNIHNTHAKPQVVYTEIKKHEHWNVVADYIRSGEKVYFASDNARDLSQLYKYLHRVCPKKSGLLIHSKHMNVDGVAFINDAADPRKITNLNYDYVLVSPSVESGVSIEYKHFTKVCAMYCGITTPTSFIQQLLRVRTATQIELFAKHVVRGAGESVLSELVKSMFEMFDLDFYLSKEGNVTFEDVLVLDEYTKMAIKNEALENAMRKDPWGTLAEVLRLRGYIVIDQKQETETVSKEEVSEIKEEIEQERQHAVLNARDIDMNTAAGVKEFDSLKTKQFLSEAERASIDRVMCKGILGDIALNESTVALTQNSNLRNQRYMYLAANRDQRALENAHFDIDSNVPTYLRSHPWALANVFMLLQVNLNIDIIKGTGEFTNLQCKEIEFSESEVRTIYALQLNVANDISRKYALEMKYSVVKRMFEKVGIHFNRETKTGVSFYTIARDPLLTKSGAVRSAGLDLMKKANGVRI